MATLGRATAACLRSSPALCGRSFLQGMSSQHKRTKKFSSACSSMQQC